MKIEREIKEGGIKGNFDKLKSVIRCFNADELKTVRNYLVFEHAEQFQGKTVGLFDYMVKNRDCELIDASKYLGGISKAAFEMTISRLKEKLCYALANEHITKRSEAFSDRFKAYCESKDVLKQYHILLFRGAQQEALDRLNYVITISQKYEWYDSLIEAYYYKLEYLKVRSEKTMYDEVEGAFVFAEFCRKAEHKAKTIFDDLATRGKAVSSRNENIELHQKCLEQLNKLAEQTQSATITYQKLKVEIGYYHELEDYEQAELKCQQLIALVTNNAAVAQPYIVGIGFLYLADTLIYTGKYADVITYAKLARKQFKPDTVNYGETLELEFFASFYSGNYTKAEKCIRELIESPSYSVSVYLKNRRRYLLACVMFAQGNYKEADLELSTISSITQDKNGFNIGIRILSLLICRMQSDYELLYAREKAFVKDLERIRKHKAIRKRDLVVFAIIKELSKRNGSFEEVYQRRKSDFDMLESKQQEYKWKPFSHEMIVFHKWFLSQLKKKRAISFTN